MNKAPFYFTGGIRTHDTRITSPLRYQTSLQYDCCWCLYRKTIDISGSSAQSSMLLPTVRRRSGDHLHYLQAIHFTTPVGDLGDGHRLQVHHTLQNTENRGKKVANPDFYVWIRKFFCFSSLPHSFFTKSSGKITFKTGPKDKTRIRSSVSSSFS